MPTVTEIAEEFTGGLLDSRRRIAELDGGLIKKNWQGGGSFVKGGVALGGADTLVLGPGIGIGDIRLMRATNADGSEGMDLILEVLDAAGAPSGDRLTMQDWFDPFNRIEKLEFADGQVLDIGNFTSFTVGTDGNDVLIGTNGNDFIHGGRGNDEIRLLMGHDVGIGGLGDDVVSGDPGDDIVIGSDGEDVVSGGEGNDTVTGNRGQDVVSGDQGDDLLAGGEGDDVIIAGEGNDVIRFSRGEGHDTVYDALDAAGWEAVWIAGEGLQPGYSFIGDTIEYNGEVIYDGQRWLGNMRTGDVAGVQTIYRHTTDAAGDSGTDSIELGIGIDLNHLHAEWRGDDLVLGIASSGDQDVNFGDLGDTLTLKGFANGITIENLVFFNTGTLNLQEFTGFSGGVDGLGDNVSATDGDDVIVGTAGKDWLTGNAGNDDISGDAGDDILLGHGGDDVMTAGAGSDVLLGGGGNDLLEGGADADILIGGAGFDTVSYADSPDGVEAHLDDGPNRGGDAEGDQLFEIEGLVGSASDDILYGNGFDNDLEGGQGDDTLYGNGGDDLYVFNLGDGQDVIYDDLRDYSFSQDVVFDASGNLTGGHTSKVTFDLVEGIGPAPLYVNEVRILNGSGGTVFSDTIVDGGPMGEPVHASTLAGLEGGWAAGYEPTGNGFEIAKTVEGYTGIVGNAGDDTILFGPGIGLSDLDVSLSGADLVIVVAGGPDQLTIKDFAADDHKIETLILNDGTSVDLSGYRSDGIGTAAADLLVGGSGADNLSGGAENDALSGLAGNDILNGGAGDDFIAGGAGSDTIDGGDGIDTALYQASGAGVQIDLSSGIAATGGDAAGDVLTNIENAIGSDFGDTITGSAANNQLRGNAGDDTLSGAAGDDVLLGDAGDDILSGGAGEDALDGGAGNDLLTGDGGDDFLVGGDGNDILKGGFGADNLIGGAGDDTLYSLDETGLGDDSFATGQFGLSMPGTSTASGVVVANATGIPTDDFTLELEITPTDVSGFRSPFSYSVGTGNANSNEIALLNLGDLRVWIGGQEFDTNVALSNNQYHRLTVSFDSSEGRITVYDNGVEVYSGTKSALVGYQIRQGGALVLGQEQDSIGGGYDASQAFKGDYHRARVWNRVLGAEELGVNPSSGKTIDFDFVESVNPGDTTVTDSIGGNTGTLLSATGLSTGTAFFAELFPGKASVSLLSGGAGNDTIRGSTGLDQIEGGLGDDIITGSSGNDKYLFSATSGHDTLNASGGLDEIIFDQSVSFDQLVFARVLDDLKITITGGDASITIKDWYLGDANKVRRIVTQTHSLSRFDIDVASGILPTQVTTLPDDAAINAALADQWQDNDLYEDHAIVVGTSSAETLDALPLAGGQTLYGFEGNDTLNGSAFNDELFGGAGNDALNGGAGDDTLHGEGGADTYDGGAGDDIFVGYGGSGFPIFKGGDGHDTIVASKDNLTLRIAQFSDIEAISGNGYDNFDINLFTGIDLTNVQVDGVASFVITGSYTFVGTAGDDLVLSGSGTQTVDGGAGDDLFVTGTGDSFDGGDGNDTLDIKSNSSASSTVDFSTGLVTWAGGDTASFSNVENIVANWQTQTIFGDDANNVFDAGSDDDELHGAGGNDTLLGGSGDDALFGDDGDDTLTGGGGHDTYDGGLGFDTVDFTYSASLWTIDLGLGNAVSGSFNEAITGIEKVVGGTSADLITGDASANTLDGHLGNDSIFGGDGDDTLIGSEGNDILDGELGDDTALYTGNFTDYAIDTLSQPGKTIITDLNATDGDDGQDTVSNVRYLQFADHTVDLGVDPNNAPYVQNPIEDKQLAVGDVFSFQFPLEAFNDFDLAFGDSLTYVATLEDGSPLPAWLSFNPASRTFSGAPGSNDVAALSVKVTATDNPPGGGPAQSISDIFTVTVDGGLDITGTTGDDTLTGGQYDDVISGDAGDDILIGLKGPDELRGDGGIDTADYSASDSGIIVDLSDALVEIGGHAQGDTLTSIENIIGSQFNDQITGGVGDNRLEGNAGNDVISGHDFHDTLIGGSGDDTLTGGAGDDILIGGAGADQFDGGTGADTVSYADSVTGVSIFMSGISEKGDAQGDVFIPGTIENVIGSSHDDVIIGDGFASDLRGGMGNDTLIGGDGNQILFGEAGDDVLQGGAGLDTLDGGAGADTASYDGTGSFVKVDLAAPLSNLGEAASDTLLSIENVIGTAFGDQLFGDLNNNALFGGGGADELRGRAGDDFLRGDGGNDTLYGDAGSDSLDGSAGDDSLYGGLDNDHLEGGDGLDRLEGEAGNDTLRGGGGNDTLLGGAGDDQIFGDAGDDTVIADDGNDTISGGAGIDIVDYSASTAAINVDLSTGVASGGFADGDRLSGIENLIGTDFGDNLRGNAADNSLDSGSGDDTLFGGAGADHLVGGLGNDTADYLGATTGVTVALGDIGGIGNVADGKGEGTAGDAAGDILEGIENLSGSNFGDILHGDNGRNIIFGQDGNDMIYGHGGSDFLFGGAGDDHIEAGSEGDRLYGGAGNDHLVGGAGDDVYYFGNDTGQDTVDNYHLDESNDVIYFDDAVTHEDIWLQKGGGGGNDLIISVLGTDTTVTIQDWFLNNTVTDFASDEPFIVDMILAGSRVSDYNVSVPALLEQMQAYEAANGGNKPTSFGDLSPTEQTAINDAWDVNPIPTIELLDPVTAISENDGGTLLAGEFITLTFQVTDNEPLTGLNITAVGDGVLFSAAIADIQAPSSEFVDIIFAANSFKAGVETITVTVEDLTGQSSSVQFNLAVNAVANGTIISGAGAGNETEAIALNLNVAPIDSDGSEVTEQVVIETIPVGAVLSDGVNSFTATAPTTSVDVSAWTIGAITLTPPAGSGADIALTVKAKSREIVGGAISGFSSQIVTVVVNGRPDILPQSFNVNEDATSGTAVGTLVSTDPDSAEAGNGTNADRRYHFAGGTENAGFSVSADNKFKINLVTGQVLVNGTLDFETAPQHQYTLEVRDKAGAAGYLSDTATLTVNVGDVNEPISQPVDNNGAANQVTEGAANGTLVGITASSIDTDGGTVTYSLTDNAGGRFAINANTGVVTVANSALIDREAAASHTITVRAHDPADPANQALAKDTQFTINVANIFEAPDAINGAIQETPWNAASPNKFIATLASNDVTMTTGSVFELTSDGNPGGLFQIVNGNRLELVNGLDFENKPAAFGAGNTVTVKYRANTAGLLSAVRTATITLQNIDEAPTQPVIADFSVNENVTGVIKSLSGISTDPEGDSIVYNFANSAGDPIGNSSGAFSISGTNLLLNNAVNYENPTVLGGNTFADLRIVAIDVNGAGTADDIKSPVKIVRVNINNLNDTAPNTPSVTQHVSSRNENSSSGSGVKIATLTNNGDADGPTPTLRIKSGANPGNNFEMRNGNELWLKASVTYDYEALANAVQTIQVEAWDGIQASAAQAINFTINNVNEDFTVKRDDTGAILAPGSITTVTLREDAILNADVFDLGVNDPDSASHAFGQHTYTITAGNTGNKFKINSAGLIEVNAGGFDYDAGQRQYDLTVEIKDNNGIGFVQTRDIQVNITNLDEAPIINTPLLTPGYEYEIIGGEWNYNLGASATDPEGVPITYSIKSVSGDVYATANLWQVQMRNGSPWLHNTIVDDTHGAGTTTIIIEASDGSVIPAPTLTVRFDWKSWTNPDSGGGGGGGGCPVGDFCVPIVLDIDGDGVELISIDDSSVMFDIDGDGVLERTGWVGKDDALLVLDRNRNGSIDDISEISFVNDLPGAQTDLEGLRAFDTNANGLIDAGDEGFAEFQIWQDKNSDGISTAKELLTLEEAGIEFISLDSKPTGETFDGATDNVIVGISAFQRTDGTTGDVGDVGFLFEDDETGERKFSAGKTKKEVEKEKEKKAKEKEEKSAASATFANPVVVDLDADGVETVNVDQSTIAFDMNGDGVLDRTGWVGPDDALLVLDRNGDGAIAGISEISFTGDLPGARTDLEGLAAFDSNGDGVFDANDTRFAEFQLWQDANQNGISEVGELRTLTEAGIAAINLALEPTGETTVGSFENVILNTAEFTRTDGTTGLVGDAAFRFIAGSEETEAGEPQTDEGETPGDTENTPNQEEPDNDTDTSAGEGVTQDPPDLWLEVIEDVLINITRFPEAHGLDLVHNQFINPEGSISDAFTNLNITLPVLQAAGQDIPATSGEQGDIIAPALHFEFDGPLPGIDYERGEFVADPDFLNRVASARPVAVVESDALRSGSSAETKRTGLFSVELLESSHASFSDILTRLNGDFETTRANSFPTVEQLLGRPDFGLVAGITASAQVDFEEDGFTSSPASAADATSLQRLVQAMAAFGPEAAGELDRKQFDSRSETPFIATPLDF